MAVDPVQSFETFEATISLFNPFGLKANEFIAHHQKESKRYVMQDYLQWIKMGPESSGMEERTFLRKASREVACVGTP